MRKLLYCLPLLMLLNGCIMPLTGSVAKIGGDTAHFTPRSVAVLANGNWLVEGDLRPTDEELTVYRRYAVVEAKGVESVRTQLDRIRPEWSPPYHTVYLQYPNLIAGAHVGEEVSLYPGHLESIDATLEDLPFPIAEPLTWTAADRFVASDHEGDRFTVNLTVTPAAWYYHHARKYPARILLGPPAFAVDLALQPVYTAVLIGAVILFMPS